MTDFARLGIAVDSGQVVRARDELGRFVQAGRNATVANDNFATSAARSAAAAAGVTSALRSAVRQMAAFAGVTASVRAVGGAAESYTKITNSLRAMGIEAGQAAGVLQSIADVANRTRAPLDATAQLYQRISIAGRDLGASQAEVLRFTENVGLALAQTGTSSQEASGALLQLSQAMAGGTVRAEEFNSILEGAFPIAQAAANAIDGASGSVGRLRQMVVDGEISSREFFEAILSQTDMLEKAFEQTVPTISQAFGVLGNNFTMFIGEMDAATSASGAVSEAILLVANNLNAVAGFAVSAGFAVGAAYAPAIYGAVTATGAWIASLITLRGALIASGVGGLVVGAGLLIGKFLDLMQATGGWGAAMRVLGTVVDGVLEGVKESASAIQPALDAVWNYVAAGFLKMVRSISRAWADFLHSVTQGAKHLDFLPGMDSTILALNNAAIVAGSGVHSLTAKIDGYQDAAGNALDRSRALIESGFEKASAALATLNLVIEQHGESNGVAADAANDLNNALQDLEKGGKKAGKGLEKVKSEAEAFAEAMEEAAYTTEDFGRAKADILIGGIDGISNAWGDFVSRGFSDFKDFAENTLSSFQGMLAQMIAMAARNRIMIDFGFGGVSGGTAQAAGGVLGGGGDGLLGAGGGLLRGGSLLGALGSGASFGISTLFSGGIGAYGALLGAQGATALTGSLTAIAGFGGALLPVIGGLVALKSAFSREYRGSGIEGAFTPNGLEDGQSFDFHKGGWFRSDKWDKSPLEFEFERTLDLAMQGLSDGVVSMADTLGLGTDALKNFEKEAFSFFTSGKTQEEIQQLLQEEMQKTVDQMAELILTNEDYIRIGETHLEALSRMSSALMGVNDVLDLLGHTAFEASLAGGDAASNLAEYFGGQEAMAAAANTYWGAFYTEAERAETVTRRLTDQFEALGLSLPESRGGFRELVESIDLTSESGRKLYAQLLNMSSAMDQVLPQAGGFSIEAMALVEQIQLAISDQISLSREAASEARQTAQMWLRTADSLQDFLGRLLNTELTSASPSQVFAQNQARFQGAYSLAMAGDAEAAQDLQGFAQSYLESLRAMSSSGFEYRRAAAQVLSKVDQVATAAADTASSEEILAGLLDEQIEVLTDLGEYLQSADAGMAGFDENIAGYQDQLQALGADIMAASRNPGIAEVSPTGAMADLFGDLTGGMLGITGPMGVLSHMLGELQGAVDADRQQREDALRISGLQVQGGDAVLRTQQAQGVVDRFNALRSEYGITLTGQDGTVSVNDAGRIVTSFDYYGGGDVVGFKAALRRQFGTEYIGRVFGDTNQDVGLAEAQAERLRQQIRNLGGIPAFARGTNFAPGGRALVGEEGPEIIDLPRGSRVHPYSQSRNMLDNTELVAEHRAMRREMAQMRSENTQLLLQLHKHIKKLADLERKREVLGAPVREVTA
ncbi:tape measure protein [Leisingera sp. ANG-Vp]|uniref:tape measure protein n=1 Tax=Leisingera sp. ANG-Vp TaxID=1577896 RepID=UPI00057EFE08|nr:tape measure protein [Leisingera sp. ANG-Vp]KIC22512.1 hypothetical protein RA20_01140 [Leisingera sp. ANG-Vp]